MNENLAFKIPNDVDKEKFQENKDDFMKLMEEDLKLIAWIAWGMDYLFRDYTYGQMFEFIGTATEADLKRHITFIDYDIATVDTESDVIFDRHYALSEDGVVIRYLDIENQFKAYPYEELEAKGIVQTCANLYWQITHGLRNFAKTVPPTGLWIFPNPPKDRKNTIEKLVCAIPEKMEECKPVGGGALQEMEVVPAKFRLEMEVDQFYLGDPMEITDGMLAKDSTAKKDKQNYLLLLFNAMYGFGVGTQRRLEIAERVFNLKGPIIEQEVKIMEELQDTLLGDVYRVGKKFGSRRTKEEDTLALAVYFSEESNNALTLNEAYFKARKVLRGKIPTATSES